MSDTAVRYLALLRLVPRYLKTITTTALYEFLEDRGFPVSIRSIQRDLKKLSDYFTHFVDEENRQSQCSVNRDATVDVIPAINLPASLTFELARTLVSPILPQSAVAQMRSHSQGARKALARGEDTLGKWPERVRVINRGLGGRRPEIAPDVLEAVTETLLKEHCAELTYQVRTWPEPDTITGHPFGLIFRDPNEYWIGYIEGREGARQLALRRARSGKRREIVADIPEDFNPDLYIRPGAMGILKSRESAV
jgi:predicted DNA-binding transcriptional regulator YafY